MENRISSLFRSAKKAISKYAGQVIKLLCPGEKFERIMNSSEKVFYGGNTNFSYAACQWIGVDSSCIMWARWGILCGNDNYGRKHSG